MKSKDNEILIKNVSQLLREIEATEGSRALCFSVIDSFKESIIYFQGSRKQFIDQVTQMIYIMKNTSPRISLIIFMFSKIYESFLTIIETDKDLEEIRKELLEIIEKVKKDRERSAQKLICAANNIIEDDDVILLHSLSSTVFAILENAFKKDISFEVIIAAQEEERTSTIIRAISKIGISFRVVPEYLLAHVKHEITKVFSGAVTINSHYHVINSAGTDALFSEMKYHKIPIYIFMTTDKFSLWKAREHHHTYKAKKAKSHHGVEYEKMIFSHDRCDIHMVDYFVTNKGVLEPFEIKEVYDRLFCAGEKWRQNHGI